ncbi:MAG: HEAT repeat domain-containing protein [Planctomycetota bacterium]|jgi:hypothetical protein
MRLALALLALVCACSGPEKDIYFASIGEDLKDLLYGEDRGLRSYRAEIDAHITSLGGPYGYKGKAWMSQWRVIRACYGLGGTKTRNAEQLALAVDKLMHVARNDPTAAARSAACLQLGRIVMRLPVNTRDAVKTDADDAEKINAIVKDLWIIKDQFEAGKPVREKDVTSLLEGLGATRPPALRSAVQVVRACSLPPVSGVAPGPVFELREKVVPGLVRDSILVLLREQACGDPLQPAPPDPSRIVRYDAMEVLIRVRSPVAADLAATRIDDDIDPPELVNDVRRQLLRYLGYCPSRQSFDTCVLWLIDPRDRSVRYQAQRSLVRMTGADVEGTPEAWRAWIDAHPDFFKPEKGAS